MEASELRIGNLIRCMGTHSKPTQCIAIIRVDSQLIERSELNNEGFNINYKPIELTEEWLINLGYETDCDISEKPMHFRKDGHLIWKPSSIFYDDLYRIELKFVHQLQNLFFALKGKELTLK